LLLRIKTLKKVFISNSEDLLTAGVAQLLRQDETLNVISSIRHPETSLLLEIKNHHPDFVIIDDTEHPLLLQILESFPQLCVIELNPHNNWIRIFERRAVYISKPYELVAVIKQISALSAE
jgi:DNA-binding NarL/FixJ family response regulator